jgi:hypothetical protein
MDANQDSARSDSLPGWQREMPSELREINREFYRQRPQEYLYRRLLSLVLMVGRPDVVADVLAEGTEVGLAKFKHPAWPVEDEAHVDYLTQESEVLHFLTAESVLRMALAHGRQDSTSPALNLIGLKSHPQFYDAIKRCIRDADDDTLDDLIVAAVHGSDGNGLQLAPLSGDSDTEPPDLEAGRQNLRELLRHLAEYVLEPNYRDVYNAAKHGLTMRSGVTGFRIGDTDSPVVDQRGQSLSCFAIGPRREGEAPVDTVTVWSNASFNLGVIRLSLDVLESIWQLGRFRFVGQPDDEPFRFQTFQAPTLTELRRLTYDAGPSRGQGPAFVTIPHMRWPTGIVV